MAEKGPKPDVQSGGSGITEPSLPLIQARKICKRFPGVDALQDVDFDLYPGEVHVLFGENGAGKSTLISIFSGSDKPTSGSTKFQGNVVEFDSVQDARKVGIKAVFQEFSLVPQLTVEENMYLGTEVSRLGKIDKKKIQKEAAAVIKRLAFPLNPAAKVVYLSRAEQQMAEIAKAFAGDEPSVLIFDEPTASLTEKETKRLFSLIEQAKKSGVGIIYITHRMGEIRQIGDRITVLRDGKVVGTKSTGSIDDEQLVEMMTGRIFDQIFPRIQFQVSEKLLEIDNLDLVSKLAHGVSLYVRSGEIVGLAGLVGSGKSEVGRACYGLEKIRSGDIRFEGLDITGRNVSEILSKGLFYLPPDRKEEGLISVRSVRENMSLASLVLPMFSRLGLLRHKTELLHTESLSEQIDLRPRGVEREVEFLSGGNQQKVLIAKALCRGPKLFIFDEPTVGVDVGTRVAIYGFLKTLSEDGAGVLLISSDLSEVLHLTNRVYVMHRGEIRAQLEQGDISEENVLRHYFDRKAA